MKSEPLQEHLWLQKLVGEWIVEGEAAMGPGKPKEHWTGTESVRSLGGLWTLGEGRGEMPGGGLSTSLMTLGYDPRKKRFVGTFVASMMTHLWIYDGALDAAARILTLDTEGPDFGVENAPMARYQDVIELESDDHRLLRSRMLGADGQWHEFMVVRYRRKS